MTYFMANMIPLGLPLAMLLAAIMTMGNLGENYELLAMKSAGMSLVRITKPLIILVSVIAVGSFFIGNNLVPYANKKVYSIIYDIRQQKQSLEFQDGLFFNGIDNMSIRVSRQEPKTHLLRDVLIYDNRIADGNMNTIVADSGYIRLSDDKRFLLVTLFNGEMYEQTRNSQWFTQSRLRHHIFDKQDQTIPMEGFAHAAQRRQPIFEQPDQEHQRVAAGYRLAGNPGEQRHDPFVRTAAQGTDILTRQLRAAAARQPAQRQERLRQPRSDGLPLGTQTPRQGADMEPGADAGQKFAQHVLVRRVGRQGGAQPAIPPARSEWRQENNSLLRRRTYYYVRYFLSFVRYGPVRPRSAYLLTVPYRYRERVRVPLPYGYRTVVGTYL